MLAYVIYQSIDWPGLSTAIATCIITALTTIGSSRQKQFLRLGGVLLGGVLFGIGAQCFLLTGFDSITGFTILFAVVTAICAWIAISSTRLSYLGVQAALAFYLINLQEFTIQSSLAVARDRLVGVTPRSDVHVAGLRSPVGEECFAGDAGLVYAQPAVPGKPD